jgi:hypothetical protein
MAFLPWIAVVVCGNERCQLRGDDYHRVHDDERMNLLHLKMLYRFKLYVFDKDKSACSKQKSKWIFTRAIKITYCPLIIELLNVTQVCNAEEFICVLGSGLQNF